MENPNKTTAQQLMEQSAEMKNLALSPLEKEIKKINGAKPALFSQVLSSQEMASHLSWMATQTSSNKFQFHPSDIPFLMNGGDISASRFLRFLPAYWNQGDYFEVYYSFRGSSPIWFSDEKIMLAPGQFLLIPPGTRKACCCPDDNCVMSFLMIRSSTFAKVFWQQLSSQNLMGMFFRQALSKRNLSHYLLFDTGGDADLEFLFYAIMDIYRSNEFYSPQIVNALTSSLLALLLQRYEQTAVVSSHSSLHMNSNYAAILNYIQTHADSVTLENLVEEFHYSRRQLLRIVLLCTGSTFAELLLKLRMEKATQLLQGGRRSIEDVAQAVGYSATSSFHRAFVKYYGFTPGKLRDEPT